MTALSAIFLVNAASRKSLEIQAQSITKPRTHSERKSAWILVFSCSYTSWKYSIRRINSFLVWISVTSCENPQLMLTCLWVGVVSLVLLNWLVMMYCKTHQVCQPTNQLVYQTVKKHHQLAKIFHLHAPKMTSTNSGFRNGIHQQQLWSPPWSC